MTEEEIAKIKKNKLLFVILKTTKIKGFKDQYHKYLEIFESQIECLERLKSLDFERQEKCLIDTHYEYFTCPLI